jgi:hypothetical protein
VIIEYEGKSYPFDFDEIRVKQAVKIEKHTGLSLDEFGKAAAAGSSMLVVQAIGWLVLHGGRDVPIEDCDFKVVPFGEAFAKAAAAEDAAQKEREAAGDAGPTPPAAPPNGSGDGATPALSLPSPLTG